MTLTRRYRFSASHRLYAKALSEAENMELYGKCSNPYGHGHNYILEISVRGPVREDTGTVIRIGDLDDLVREQVLSGFDHRDMNQEIAAFGSLVPTTENVALEIRRRLLARWDEAFPDGLRLERIRLHETRKNIFEVSGN